MDVNLLIIHLLSHNLVLGKTIASAVDATVLHTHVFSLWLKMKMLTRVVQKQQSASYTVFYCQAVLLNDLSVQQIHVPNLSTCETRHCSLSFADGATQRRASLLFRVLEQHRGCANSSTGLNVTDPLMPLGRWRVNGRENPLYRYRLTDLILITIYVSNEIKRPLPGEE